MAEPIEYRVLRNLQAALAAITVAGGYYHTVQATAVKLDPNQDVEALVAPDGPRPFVVLEVQPESWEYNPAHQVVLVLPWIVHWFHESAPLSDAAMGEPTPPADEQRQLLFWRGCADIERAVAADIGRGGLATDTRIVKRTFDDDPDSQLVHAVVDLEIRLHRTYGQPSGA